MDSIHSKLSGMPTTAADAPSEGKEEGGEEGKAPPITAPSASAAVHYDVICDGCQNFVVGNRYKCG